MIRFRSPRLTASFSVLLTAAALTCARAASADIAAPEYCPSPDSVGQSCSTAGPNFDEDGICLEVACDGGSAPCGLLCELAPDGGYDGGSWTNPPDGGPVLPPTNDGGIITVLPPYDGGDDAGPITPPPNGDDAGHPPTGTDAGGTANGASSSLQGSSGCSATGAGADGMTGGGLFAFGALGFFASAAARRRRKA